MPEDNRPKCYRCKGLYIHDYGYSDWTVEGTSIECLHKRFEEMEKEYDDSQDGVMIAAAKDCPKYIEGEPLEHSVDGYDDEELEARKKEIGVKKP